LDECDLATVPFEGNDARADGNLASHFEGVEVALGIAPVNGSNTFDGAGGIEHVLDQHGLPSAAVAYNGNVSYLIGGVILHLNISF